MPPVGLHFSVIVAPIAGVPLKCVTDALIYVGVFTLIEFESVVTVTMRLLAKVTGSKETRIIGCNWETSAFAVEAPINIIIINTIDSIKPALQPAEI